jgi:hypothetical protein
MVLYRKNDKNDINISIRSTISINILDSRLCVGAKSRWFECVVFSKHLLFSLVPSDIALQNDIMAVLITQLWSY